MSEFTPDPELKARLDRVLAKKAQAPRLCLPKGYLSCSQVEMYLRCPRQYQFRYVRDEKDPPGASLIFGSGAHEALEFTHHHIVDHGDPAQTDEVLDTFSDSFDRRLAEVEKIDWQAEKTTEGALKDMGVSLVKTYNQKWAPNVKPKVYTPDDVNEKGETVRGQRGIERKFDVKIAGVPVIGFIDLVDTNDPFLVSPTERELLRGRGTDVPEEDRTVVCDFKTAAKSKSQNDVDAALQLTLYSYVEKVPAVRFDQLLKQKVPKIKRITSMRRKADYLWLEEVVRDVASAISAGVFPPCNPLEWCCSPKWCGFYFKCRGAKK